MSAVKTELFCGQASSTGLREDDRSSPFEMLDAMGPFSALLQEGGGLFDFSRKDFCSESPEMRESLSGVAGIPLPSAILSCAKNREGDGLRLNREFRPSAVKKWSFSFVCLAFFALFPLIANAQEPSFAHAENPSVLVSQATVAWQGGDYLRAAELYKSVVEQGVVNEDLLFNWGTAELRAGRRGWAILAFERGLRLAPGDPDLRFNLEAALRGNIDRVDGEHIEPSWLERVAQILPLRIVGAIFVVCWPLAFAAFILLRWRRIPHRTRLFLGGLGSVSAGCALLAALCLAVLAYVSSLGREGVVVVESAAVREGPAQGFRASFEIHEGSKVRLLEESEGFVRIRLANGNEGWVKAAEVPAI